MSAQDPNLLPLICFQFKYSRTHQYLSRDDLGAIQRLAAIVEEGATAITLKICISTYCYLIPTFHFPNHVLLRAPYKLTSRVCKVK